MNTLSVNASDLARWRRAIRLVFLTAGLMVSTWLSLIAPLGARLGLGVANIWWLIAASAVGGLLGLVVAPHVANIVGSRAAILAGASWAGLCLCGTAASVLWEPSVLWALLGAGATAAGFATVDVSMNASGLLCERASGQAEVSAFHAMFSVGAALGAAFAVAMSAHMLFVQVVVVAALGCALCYISRRSLPATERQQRTAKREKVSFREILPSRVILICCVAFVFALAESTGGSWVSIVASQQPSSTNGPLALAVFMTAAGATRFIAGRFQNRWGRTWCLRFAAGIAIVGVLFTLAPGPLVFLGSFAWGIGTALGTPLSISAAGEGAIAEHLPLRASAVSTFCYSAGFLGPWLIGGSVATFGLVPTFIGLAASLTLAIAGCGLMQIRTEPPEIALVGNIRA